MGAAPRHTLLVSLALAPLAMGLVGMFFLPDADFYIRRGGEIQAYAGADFLCMYEAARAAITGEVDRLYDFVRFNEHLAAEYPGVPFHSWSYPPTMLLLLAPLGLLPYGAAFALWQGGTLALCLWACWPDAQTAERGRMTRILVVAAIVVAPATWLNLFGGQNGFLIAALFIGGFRLLKTKPLLAGVLFGLLTVKPHFGIVIPFALVLLRAWPAIASAAATAIGLAGLSLLAFGVAPWVGMIEVTAPHQLQLVQAMEGFYTLMMPTVIAALRQFDLPPAAAVAGHVAAAGVALGACWLLLRRADDWRRQAFIVGVTTILVTPYYFNYDMVAVSALACLILAGSDWSKAPLTPAAATLMLAAPALTMHLAIADWPLGFALAGLALALLTPRAALARAPAGRLAPV